MNQALRDAQIYLAQHDFPSFIRTVAPWYILEYVHIAIARHLEAVLHGEIDRLMIEMAPRGGKSTMISELFPSFYLGHHPADKVMAGSHTESLAREFGGQVRELLKSDVYQSIFPGVQLVPNKRAEGRWFIQSPYGRRGEYFAFGIGKAIAGRGFNLGLLDDTLSEQTKDSEAHKERAKRWYPGGFYTRRQPERNAIIFIGTRWVWDDLQGFLIEKSEHDPDADKWTVLSIPALLDHKMAKLINGLGATDPIVAKQPKLISFDPMKEDSEQEGGSFSPRRFPLPELIRSRDNMPTRDWEAQYMQTPSADEGSIMKRSYWRKWPAKKKLPEPILTLACLDTAFEASEDNDNSAFTVWYIFETTDVGPNQREYQHYHMLLAGAWAEQVDAADLIKEMETNLVKVFKPDIILVEKRASGIQLIQEMKRRRLPVRPWLPPGPQGAKGKRPRALAAQLVMEQGGVWYVGENQDGEELKWPKLVIDECARVPYDTTHDDIADTVTMATIFLRRHYWLGLPMDELTDEEEEELAKAKMLAKGRRLYGAEPIEKGKVFDTSKRRLYG